jgi:hypothetical protein
MNENDLNFDDNYINDLFSDDSCIKFPDNNLSEEETNIDMLEKLMKDIGEFSDKTFGKDRPYTAPLHHLKEEIEEVLPNGDMMEYADCFLLLLDSFRKRYPNAHISELIETAFEKMEILRKRKWHAPDKNLVFKHVKEDEETL